MIHRIDQYRTPLNRILISISAILLMTSTIFPQDEEFDEDALFSDTTSVIDSMAVIVDKGIIAESQDEKSFGVTGQVAAVFQPSIKREWFVNNFQVKDILFSSYTMGSLFLDARIPGGFKAFTAAEALYNPAKDSIYFGLTELFLDANIKRRFYFRAGKQVLQWGRCFLWNPTDLINVEKKQFISQIGSREGVYGLKTHIPFGTLINIYNFMNIRKITQIENIAVATKLEFLLGRTEMALSLWAKKRYKPVYAFDFSSRLGNFQIYGEAALYQEYTIYNVDFDKPEISEEIKNWLPKISVGFNRYFTINGIPDRLMTIMEFYYNQPGYTFRKIPIPNNIAITDSLIADIVAKVFEPNNFSRFYLAFFSSLNRFIINDMTLSINAIGNLNQRSAMLTTSLSYQTMHNFFLELLFTGYLGKGKTEYTIAGEGMQIRLYAGLSF